MGKTILTKLNGNRQRKLDCLRLALLGLFTVAVWIGAVWLIIWALAQLRTIW